MAKRFFARSSSPMLMMSKTILFQANCLATKINLCLKMRCLSNANTNEIIGNDLPGNILLFMP